MNHNDLISRINERDFKVSIIGLGYVGLPLLIRFVEEGFPVLGIDIDESKINSLSEGISYIKHIDSQKVGAMVGTGKASFTSDLGRVSEADAVIICLPTPLSENQTPDLSYITSSMSRMKDHLRKGQILSLESTTYPGTTEEVIRPYVEERGFKVGEDFFIVYSPEREDPGNPKYDTKSIPKVCGADDKASLELGIELYSKVVDKVIPLGNTRSAEMTKLLENIHRAVNIGLVNELKVVCDKMGIDIYDIINAASTKPFGFTPYYPGPGLGGHCIPIDPYYLTWKARQYGVHTKFIELAGEINNSMPDYVINKISLALNEQGKPLRGSKVLVLGLAYKKNVDDVRESPSLEVIKKLREVGVETLYHDPFVPTFPKTRKYKYDMDSMEISEENLKEVDCVVVCTDHDNVDYASVFEFSRSVVDARGRYPNSSKVIRA